jgi:surface carbohydrate biosynthesis protein
MRIVNIPLETKVRELEGKLWMALHFARAGWQVNLGPPLALETQLDVAPPDVHFFTSSYATGYSLAAAKRVKAKGGKLAVLDTEGAIYRDQALYKAARLSPELLRQIDYFFAWGEDAGDIVRRTVSVDLAGQGPKTIVSGNPCFDLLQSPADGIFDPDVSALRQEFGRFILINTNFSYVNPYSSDTADQRTSTPEVVGVQTDLLARVIAAVKLLATRSAGMSIVVRPHPSENHDHYRRAFAGHPTISVVHRGPVTPWLKACTVLVHNVCTTGVEAALLGKPVLAYCPTRYHQEEESLANAMSVMVRTDQDLMEQVEAIVASDENVRQTLDEKRKQRLQEFIANVDFSATKKIVSALEDARRDSTASGAFPDYPFRERVRTALLAVGGERALDALRGARSAKSRRQLRYLRQKIPYIHVKELEALAERMTRVDPGLAGWSIRKIRGLEYSFTITNERTRGR